MAVGDEQFTPGAVAQDAAARGSRVADDRAGPGARTGDREPDPHLFQNGDELGAVGGLSGSQDECHRAAAPVGGEVKESAGRLGLRSLDRVAAVFGYDGHTGPAHTDADAETAEGSTRSPKNRLLNARKSRAKRSRCGRSTMPPDAGRARYAMSVAYRAPALP